MGVASGGNMSLISKAEYRRDSTTKSIVTHNGESHEKFIGDKITHIDADTYSYVQAGKTDVTQTESAVRASSVEALIEKTEETEL